MLWRKGETSGAFLRVSLAAVDCDGDALLFEIGRTGPACRTGESSCFGRTLSGDPAAAGGGARGSYTASLFASGTTRIAQKVAEEGAEAALAAATKDAASLPGEVADLFYHALALLADAGLSPEDVWAELRSRRG